MEVKTKRKIKAVYFGDTEEEILNYANSINNFSEWVKSRLNEEMEGRYIRQTLKELIRTELSSFQINNKEDVDVSLDDLDQFY